MGKNWQDIRIFLIQIREREDVTKVEHQCYLERCEINADQLDWINVVNEPVIPWERIASCDVVMIGGAGVHSVTKEHPFSEPLTETVQKIHDNDIPLFGACWGHQFIAKALGGKVINDPDKGEAGTNPVTLTDGGKQDSLFGELPETFLTQMGHNDRVSELPPGGIELAKSEVCPYQAFKIEGKPIYGTQFHSELTRERLAERLTLYKHIYVGDGVDFDAFIDSLKPTPETDCMLKRFIKMCI